jgi:hypothetical protein
MVDRTVAHNNAPRDNPSSIGDVLEQVMDISGCSEQDAPLPTIPRKAIALQ